MESCRNSSQEQLRKKIINYTSPAGIDVSKPMLQSRCNILTNPTYCTINYLSTSCEKNIEQYFVVRFFSETAVKSGYLFSTVFSKVSYSFAFNCFGLPGGLNPVMSRRSSVRLSALEMQHVCECEWSCFIGTLGGY